MSDHYVTQSGAYYGAYGDGAKPDPESSPEGLINIGDEHPDSAEQIWLFPGWTPIAVSVDNFSKATQDKLDNAARSFGYDDIRAAVTYADEPSVEKFQVEGQAFRAWRSKVWAYSYEQLAKVQSGERPQPTIEQFLAELPPLDLPQQ